MTSPSSTGSGPTSDSRTVAASPGMRLPTRSVNTPGALLLGDRGAMTGRDRLVVLLARRAALVDDAFDDAPGDLHAEAVHRRAIGQREDVRRLDRDAGRVDERLRDLDRRDHAGDARVDVHRASAAAGRARCASAPKPASALVRPKLRHLLFGHQDDRQCGHGSSMCSGLGREPAICELGDEWCRGRAKCANVGG